MPQGTKLVFLLAAVAVVLLVIFMVMRRPGVKVFLQALKTPTPMLMSAASVLENPSEYKYRRVCFKGTVLTVTPLDAPNEQDPISYLFDGISAIVQMRASDGTPLELWLNQAANAIEPGSVRDLSSIAIGSQIQACGFASVGGTAANTLLVIGTAHLSEG